MTDNYGQIKDLLKKELKKDDSESRENSYNHILHEIIKMERKCLYGEKSTYGKRKEILHLIISHADEEDALQ